MSRPQDATAERFHPRVEADDLEVRVHLNGRAYRAWARDLSMAGMFLLAAPPEGHDRFSVTLPLPGREVTTQCTVRRRLPEGVGLQFDALDWDDLFALARFLHPRLP